MPELPTFIFLSVVVGIWYYLTRAREIATLRCKSYCQQIDLQLLDQSIHRTGFRLQRNFKGMLMPVLFYSFNFSISGEDRHKGCLIVKGLSLHQIEMDHPEGRIIWRQNTEN